MPRRFLTTEDLRRLSAAGQEIVIDEETLLTPHAEAFAAENGLALRTRTGGAYVEPAPDRGPDAERAQTTLPNLPEPKDEDSATSLVITAVGKNRPGVLSEVTTALATSRASVQNISQRMIEGYFHLVLTVEIPPESSFAKVKQCLECLGGPDDYVVRVMHERVFRFMHRV
ncbi:MAG: ACT domain-containing protein [Planctomycetes bacterium]|nr:ACT domain-containing protein [Planctomycetota bacterium]